MKIKEITVSMQRPIRHAQYRVSNPSISLVGIVEEGEDANDAVDELMSDCGILLKRAVTDQLQLYRDTQKEVAEAKEREIAELRGVTRG